MVTSTMPTIPANWPTPIVKNIQGSPSTQPAIYSAIDEANMETVASDPLPYPQRSWPTNFTTWCSKSGRKHEHPGIYNSTRHISARDISADFHPGVDSRSICTTSYQAFTPTCRDSTMLVVVLASLVFALVVTPLDIFYLGVQTLTLVNNQPATTTNNGNIQQAIKAATSLLLLVHKGCPPHQPLVRQRVLHERLFLLHSFWVRIQPLSTLSMKALPTAPTFGTVKSYNTITAIKLRLTRQPTRTRQCQVSADGQWVLFTAHVVGQSELRVVRID